MLIPHLHLNGKCMEAMELYKEAFNASVTILIYNSENEPENGVMHAEMLIHNQRVMLNDFGGSESLSKDSAVHIVTFASEQELRCSYEILKSNSITIYSIQVESYTPCTVGFVDKYGVRWGFIV
jgi:PhnB protein